MEEQEEELYERIVEQKVDVPVQQITVPVPSQEEIVEVIKPFSAERISERTGEQIVDLKQIMEVAKIIPQERTSEHTVGVPARLRFSNKFWKSWRIIPQERTPEHTWCASASDLGRGRRGGEGRQISPSPRTYFREDL